MRMRSLTLSMVLVCLVAGGCAGARGSLAFDQLRYPVSSSPYLYGPDEQIVEAGRLTSLTSFEVQQRIWGIFWSFIPLSGTEDISEAINQRITAAGGEGVTNLAVQVENCGMNYVPIINWLPIYPACTLVTVTGSVVKLAEPARSPAASAPQLSAARIRAAVQRGIANASTGKH